MRRERAVVVDDRRDDGERTEAGQRAMIRARMLASLVVCSALSVSCGFINSDGAPPSPEALAAAAGESGADATTAVETSAPVAAGARGAASKPATGSNASAASTGGTTTPASSTINSVDTIVNDMKLANDLTLAGVPLERGWATGTGQVIMGNDPRGSRTPSWWSPYNGYYKSDAYWTQIVPWMAIFDGVGNGASNTRVELRPMKAYYKSRSSGQWILLSQGTIDGQNYPKYLNAVQSGSPDIVSIGSGVVSVRPPSTELHFHGWSGARALPNPADVAAIHVTLQARLAVNDPSRPDDRAAARYLVQVGGDYYPDASLNLGLFAPVQWNPGIGLSRSKLIGNNWQSYSFTTIDVGVQTPGGAAISEAELRRAPPPLD